MMSLRRFGVLSCACLCAFVLAGADVRAGGEEIVVETAALVSTQPQSWIDYAVATRLDAWALGNATCLKIVDYGETTGDLVMDATTTFGTSPDHRTYSFTIGSGHGFFGIGGPKGPVTAADFKRAFERATSPAMAASIGGAPPARQHVAGIVGAADFFAGTAAEIAGIQASGNELTIELTEPDAAFRYKLALPYFCATHESAPPGFTNVPLPSAGPYFVSEASTIAAPEAQHVIVLVRNPEYGGTRVRNLGSIVWVQHGSPLAEDYVVQAPQSYTPPANVQFVATTTIGVQLLALNTSKPPFDDILVRRAAAYALDRTALSGLLGWQPTDQFMSPLLPGYADSDVYPLAGNPTTATSILAGATPSVTLCHPGGADPRVAVAQLAETQLEAVGFEVTRLQPSPYFAGIADPATCNLALLGVTPDFPDGSRILGPLFRTGSPSNFSFFSDAGFDARLDALPGIVDESTRMTELAMLDAHLSDSAAALAIGHSVRRDAFSERIGCRLLNQALFGYPVNRLCVQVAETAAPGGTVSTGGDASPAAPLQTAVTVPGGGAVTITQGQIPPSETPEYTLLEQEVQISAPEGTPENPLLLTFQLDAGLLAAAGLTIADVTVYRNGAAIAHDCAAVTAGEPCVLSRTMEPDGDGELVVRTVAASSWTFGERYDVGGGLLSPVKRPPLVNDRKAGAALPLKFGLGGDEGLSVLAAGSPSSAPATCTGFVPTGPGVPASINGGGLAYDPATQTYELVWKTDKAWAGTCRVLTIRFREGSTLTALVRFK
jgi:ABC-type transport system substrate-binding protein